MNRAKKSSDQRRVFLCGEFGCLLVAHYSQRQVKFIPCECEGTFHAREEREFVSSESEGDGNIWILFYQ